MSDPILKIGRVVEVSGSKVIGELEGTVEDYTVRIKVGVTQLAKSDQS